jgi:TonB family protein
MINTLYKITLLTIILFAASVCFGQAEVERGKGVELFNKGNFKEAVAVLEKVVKAAPADVEARTFLGLSQLKLGKMKDAGKTLEKSLELNPNQPNARKALAYVYLLRGKMMDSVKQMEALKALNEMDAESFYILGWANLRLGNFDEALENAEQSVKLNPKMPNAYFLKAQAIMNRRDRNTDYKALAAKYGSAADNIGKFILLTAADPDNSFWRGQQDTLKVFAAYYAEKEKNKADAEKEDDEANSTPVKIISKPRAAYSDRARQAGVSGTIRLLAAFSEKGKVEHVLVLTSLGYGLDEEAVKAARGIRFTPRTVNGKPVTTVKAVEYTFTIY